MTEFATDSYLAESLRNNLEAHWYVVISYAFNSYIKLMIRYVQSGKNGEPMVVTYQQQMPIVAVRANAIEVIHKKFTKDYQGNKIQIWYAKNS